MRLVQSSKDDDKLDAELDGLMDKYDESEKKPNKPAAKKSATPGTKASDSEV